MTAHINGKLGDFAETFLDNAVEVTHIRKRF